MRPKVLIIGSQQQHIDHAVTELEASNLTASATSSHNLSRTVFDAQDPDVVVMTLGVPAESRKSIRALIGECDARVQIIQQTDDDQSLVETVRHAAKRWSTTNAR